MIYSKALKPIILRFAKNYYIKRNCTGYNERGIIRGEKHQPCRAGQDTDILGERKETDEECCLSCKRAVVVGGEEGIGHACAKELLQANCQRCGIFGKNICKGMEAVHRLNCTHGRGKSTFYQTDVTCNEDIESSIAKMNRDHGRIDVFVNAFGMCDGKNWETELATNLLGMARCTLLEFEYFQRFEHPGGHIVNTAGIFGFSSFAGSPTVSAAQHGIIGLSTSLGDKRIYEKSKVRIMTICPGYTKTKFFQNASKRAFNPSIGQILNEQLNSMSTQKPEACGKACIHALRFGKSGSVWIVESSKLYKVEIPDPKSYSEILLQYFI